MLGAHIPLLLPKSQFTGWSVKCFEETSLVPLVSYILNKTETSLVRPCLRKSVEVAARDFGQACTSMFQAIVTSKSQATLTIILSISTSVVHYESFINHRTTVSSDLYLDFWSFGECHSPQRLELMVPLYSKRLNTLRG